ncbi:MAG: hypothetical protein ACLP50_37785 [Solirubrobacteraceae bacterium]
MTEGSEIAHERSEPFAGLSELLTGFDRVRLLGTGMIGEYLRALDAVLPAGLVDELLAAFRRLPEDADREAAVASEILADPKLGPVAQNVILLWYCGTWRALPDAWRAAYGRSPLDTDRVVSAQAYQAGLQWVVAGAHPAGARQQGFGAWAVAPGAGG